MINNLELSTNGNRILLNIGHYRWSICGHYFFYIGVIIDDALWLLRCGLYYNEMSFRS